MEITLQIAGFYIHIVFHHTIEGIYAREKLKKEIISYTKKFQVVHKSRYHYSINFVNMDFFKALSHSESGNTYFSSFVKESDNEIKTYYEISIFQFQLILKLVLYELLKKHEGYIIHASSILYKKKALLFLGPEGAGKSTAIALLGETYRPLSDDTTILRKIENEYIVYQWPIVEKQWWIKKKNEQYPLGGIYFLKQAKKTKIVSVHDRSKIFVKIYNQIMIDEKDTKKYLAFTKNFIDIFENFYTLYFELDAEKMIKTIRQHV